MRRRHASLALLFAAVCWFPQRLVAAPAGFDRAMYVHGTWALGTSTVLHYSGILLGSSDSLCRDVQDGVLHRGKVSVTAAVFAPSEVEPGSYRFDGERVPGQPSLTAQLVVADAACNNTVPVDQESLSSGVLEFLPPAVDGKVPVHFDMTFGEHYAGIRGTMDAEVCELDLGALPNVVTCVD